MKGRVIGIVSGLIASGLLLYLAAPQAVSSFFSSASSQEELAELTAGSAATRLGKNVTRSYEWYYDDKKWTWELSIPAELYNYYQGMTRADTVNYSVYVTHPLDDEYIRELAMAIKDAADKSRYSKYKTTSLAATFVQNLPYNHDSETTPYDEYPRYPVETLVDNGGDCEDTSILLASILDSMGYSVVLLNLPQHVAVGVLCGECVDGRYYPYNGENYYYLETTNPGWRIGELLQTYRFDPAYVYGIELVPILTHSWTTGIKDGLVILDVTVSNSGAIAADDVWVWAGFETDEGQWLNSEVSSYLTLPPRRSETVRLALKTPPNKHARLLIQVVDDGWSAVSSYSCWFDT
jgi:hypothetical protein